MSECELDSVQSTSCLSYCIAFIVVLEAVCHQSVGRGECC